MHPFSDGSGVAFFDPLTTIVSSVVVDITILNEWLISQEALTNKEKAAVLQLQSDGIIEKIESKDSD